MASEESPTLARQPAWRAEPAGSGLRHDRTGGAAWLAFALLCLPWLLWTWHECIHLDFSYDEVYTLIHFVFVSPYRTVTDYSYPNNHILFSLLTNMYVTGLGLPDTFAAMDAPWLLRLPSVVFAVLTLVVIFQTARRCAGRLAGLLAVVVLATSLPFFQFAWQVRGYSLGTLLLTVMLYALVRWEQTVRLAWLAAAGAAGGLALYTLPSNLYFVVGVGTFHMMAALWRARLAQKSPPKQTTLEGGSQEMRPTGREGRESQTAMLQRLLNRDSAAVLSLVGAVVLAVMLYSPVLKQLLSHDYLQSRGTFRSETLTVLAPKTLGYFLSGRPWLLLFPAAAVVAGWLGRSGEAGLRAGGRLAAPGTTGIKADRRSLARQDRSLWRCMGLCLTVLVVPFLCSWVRGDTPPIRVFVNLAPVFALLMAVSARIAWNVLPQRRALGWAGLGVLTLACYGSLSLSLRDVHRHILADIEQGRMGTEVPYLSFVAYFNPGRAANEVAARWREEPAPVYIYEYGDRMALGAYMQKTRLLHTLLGDPAEISLAPGEILYVVTAWPERVRRRILEVRPALRCEVLTPQPDLFGVLLCRG